MYLVWKNFSNCVVECSKEFGVYGKFESIYRWIFRKYLFLREVFFLYFRAMYTGCTCTEKDLWWWWWWWWIYFGVLKTGVCSLQKVISSDKYDYRFIFFCSCNEVSNKKIHRSMQLSGSLKSLVSNIFPISGFSFFSRRNTILIFLLFLITTDTPLLFNSYFLIFVFYFHDNQS